MKSSTRERNAHTSRNGGVESSVICPNLRIIRIQRMATNTPSDFRVIPAHAGILEPVTPQDSRIRGNPPECTISHARMNRFGRGTGGNDTFP